MKLLPVTSHDHKHSKNTHTNLLAPLQIVMFVSTIVSVFVSDYHYYISLPPALSCHLVRYKSDNLSNNPAPDPINYLPQKGNVRLEMESISGTGY